MSLNRPRSLSRQRAPRALTLPTHYTQSPVIDTSSTTTSSSAVNIDLFLPSMEESLQDWLSRNIPEASSPSPLSSLIQDICPCCGKHNCEHMETLYTAMRKLESDTRLAAEIGQGLLHKHEALIAETNQTKEVLEQQLAEVHEKASTLEMLLVDADNRKQELIEEKDKSIWKWQKSQQALQETTLDLEKANDRCIEIGNELKNKTKEVEKLRIFKFMVRQADYREDMLRSQLEDTNQELAISRKNELMLESKYKKLKARYEMVCTTYEKLKLDKQPVSSQFSQQKKSINDDKQLYALWEANQQLRNDITKLTALISNTSSPSLTHQNFHQQPDQNYLIALIKELALANAKLKMELLSGSLSALESNLNGSVGLAQDETTDDGYVSTLFASPVFSDDMFHMMTAQTPPNDYLVPSLFGDDGDNEDDDKMKKSLSTSAPQSDRLPQSSLLHAASAYSSLQQSHQQRQQKQAENDIEMNTDDTAVSNTSTAPTTTSPAPNLTSRPGIPTKVPSPTTSTSLPTSKPDVVHYHYHYHMQKKKRQLAATTALANRNVNKAGNVTMNRVDRSTSPPKIVLSSSPSDMSTDPVSMDTSNENESHHHIESHKDEGHNTPYHQLQTHASQVFDRLKSTDIRSLNRQLRRAFDMMELSSMSNSIIDSVLTDILLLQGQFLWVRDGNHYRNTDDERSYENDKEHEDYENYIQQQQQEQQQHYSATLLLSAFFPLLTLLQNMLKEIGELRMTMNELQVEYVKKVEEMEDLVKQDILRKRQEAKKPATSILSSTSPSSPFSEQHGISSGSGRALAWLSNVFQLPAPTPTVTKTTTIASTTTITDPAQRSLRYQRSCDSISTARHTLHPSHDADSKQPMMTTSSSLRIKQKKSELDRFGPPSSFPRSSSMTEQKRRRRSGSNQTKQQYGQPLRPSVSAGPVRKCASPAVWPVPPPGENIVQRKRSLLGLGAAGGISASGSSEPLEKIDSVDWQLGTSFGGSWLGT